MEKIKSFIKKIISNKKMLITAIAIVVVLIAAITLTIVHFATHTIKGAWELKGEYSDLLTATADEAEQNDNVTYYIFSKPDRYGKGEVRILFDGFEKVSEYQLSKKDGKDYINLEGEQMEYTIKGSALFSNLKLTIIIPAKTDSSTGIVTPAEEYAFDRCKDPKYEKKSYDEYDIDKELLGKWSNNERGLESYYIYIYRLPYTQNVEFLDNGIFTVTYNFFDEEVADIYDLKVYYAYSAKDNMLTLTKLYSDETYYIKYEIKDGKLNFIDDNTNCSIYYDALFGGYTFYRPEDMPQPTQQETEELYYIEETEAITENQSE